MLVLEGFSEEEIKQHFNVCAVNPGRRDLFNTFYSIEENSSICEDVYEIRKLSDKEYYHTLGSPRWLHKLNQRKSFEQIVIIETNIPSAKTAGILVCKQHVQCLMDNMNRLFDFYRNGIDRLLNFIGKQRTLYSVVNDIIDGGIKCNRNNKKRKR